jgi:hypothetical protein
MDIGYPTLEPPKPPPRATKKEARALLFELHNTQLRETGVGTLLSGPMQAEARKALEAQIKKAGKQPAAPAGAGGAGAKRKRGTPHQGAPKLGPFEPTD